MILTMSNTSSSARMLERSALARVFRAAGKWLAALVLVTLTAGFGSCSGGGSSAPNYVLQGSVSGLLPGHSVALQNFGSDTITVSANGSFQFNRPVAGGAPYSVTVNTQPIGETCAAVNGSGTGMVGPGIEVTLACTLQNYTVSGSILYWFAPGGMVLRLNGGDATTVLEPQSNVPASFTFSTTLPYGTPYTVTIDPTPPYIGCGFTNNSQAGTATADVTNVSIECTGIEGTVGATVSGLLPNSSLVLTIITNFTSGAQADPLTVTANGVCTQCVAYGLLTQPYQVTILTQPPGETCTGNLQGSIQDSTNVSITCAPSSHTIGGTVSGLSAGKTVVLQDNSGNATTVSANGPFTFSTSIAYQSPYVVTVATQPSGGTCAVSNGSGTMPAANVTNVAVACMPTALDAGLWTWASGSNAPEFAGVYGTQGTAAPGNVPGGREAAFSWTDSAGDLWMFGGIGAGNSGVGGSFNDLWRYSPSTGLWAWMGGADTLDAVSVYGTKGTAAVSNMPSAREGGAAWTDAAGNFWMFGGGGFDSTGNNDALNDLWRYSPSSGLWTWMSGATTGNLAGVYGTRGTPAPGNVPGSRSALVSWKDGAGNFWLFGGAGFDLNDLDSYLNDLWRYNPSTNQWTWMNGSTQGGGAGVYGAQGTAAAGNVPGARAGAVSWSDASGNFWLFGGRGHDSNGTIGVLNDLWQYSPTTGRWTWMSGSMTAGAPGAYGTLGTPAAGNVPGARQDAASWIDTAGNLWLFGDGTFDSSGNLVSAGNDLWRYSPSTGLWTWMGGSTTPGALGVYGTQGVAAPGNIPPGRDIGLPWTDNAGQFWLFGGYVPASALNDLWKYVPPVP
jgi:N-acetylneuraminic acid mutarotase